MRKKKAVEIQTDGLIRRKFHGHEVDLTCEKCGEPIETPNPSFGMDCKNRCMEKQWAQQMAKLEDEAGGFPGITGSLLKRIRRDVRAV